MKSRDNTATPRLNDQAAIRTYVTWASRRNHRPKTIEHRMTVLRIISGQLPSGLLDATPADLALWDAASIGMAVNTRRSYIGALHAFYRAAVDADLLAMDPARRIVAPKTPRALPRPLPSTPTMDALDTLAGRERLTVMLMVGSGLRSCEVAILRRPDVLAGPDGPMLHVREGKGGHERVIPIPEWLAAEVSAHGGRYVVIESRRGGPLTASGVQSVAKRALDDAGVTGTPHQLRHTFLTELYAQTKDIRFVQEVAGHLDPRTTAGYVAFAGGGNRDAIEKLPRPASSTGLRVVS